MKPLFIFTLFLSVCSCGNGADKSTSQITYLSSELSGNYLARLRPINSPSSGFLPSGAAELNITEKDFRIKTYLDDDSKIMHIQSIHAGSTCPTVANDTNKDGFIDILEAQKVVGPVLIPLDGDLDSETDDHHSYPKGKSFTYTAVASLPELMTVLQNKNTRPVFQMEGKVVLIHGTSDLSRVPPTVATLPPYVRNISLPIACGILKRR